jgi:RNA polymerase sigma-70 factor (ECF subfamily)
MTAAPRREACGRAVTCELLVRSGRGDREAFAELYDITSGPAFRLARCLAGEEGAEEVFVRGYLEAWRAAAEFDPAQGSAVAWLLRRLQRVAAEQWSGRVAS